MMCLRLIFVACLAGCCATVGLAADPVFRVELIRGAAETGTISRFSPAGLTLTAASERTIPVSDLVSFHRLASANVPQTAQSAVLLAAGDQLACEIIGADDENLTVRWPALTRSEPFTIPLEHVQAVILQMPRSDARRQRLYRNLATDPLTGDVAWLEGGDRLSGEIVSLNGRELTFSARQDELHVDREKVIALRTNPDLITVTKPRGLYFLLTFSDGSHLFAKECDLEKNRLRVRTLFGAELQLKAAELAAGQIFNDLIVPLSTIAPSAVRQTPFLSESWNWVKDRNVLSGPLRIGGREFGLGLGVHSRCELTYDLGPKDREFRAVVGIDHAAGGGGNVVFSVLLDGKQAWKSPAVTGKTEPLTMAPINLRGKRQLTLVVDFGDLGDVLDYANWCNPILLREP